MRLAYITRVGVPSNAAQAVQIQAMSKAFRRVLDEGAFSLICGMGIRAPADMDGVDVKSISIKFKPFRNLLFMFEALKVRLFFPHAVVFTRDIAVALIVVLLGGTVLYEAHKEPKGRASRTLMVLLSKCKCFKLVVISRALFDFYREKYQIPEARIIVAHDGTFPERFSALSGIGKVELRKRLNLDLHKKILVNTGNIKSDRAEEMIEEILEGNPGLVFVQVGGDPRAIASIELKIDSRFHERLVVVPWCPEDVVACYQMAADALLYVIDRRNPLAWCTSPLKLFEYMSSGRPVVAARVGAVAEIVSDDNAFCFDPDEVGGASMAVNEAINESALAELKAAVAREQVCRSYSWYERAKKLATFAGIS